MFKKLSKRNKRALVLLVTFLLGIVLLNLLLSMYDQYSALADQMDTKEKALQRALRARHEQTELNRQLDSVGQAVQRYQQYFLDSRDAQSASAEVEQIVRLLAQQNGVKVTRSSPLKARKVGDDYEQIGVQLTIECDLGNLVNLLHAISSHQKFLQVDNFTLTSFRLKDKSRIQPRMYISGFIRL